MLSPNPLSLFCAILLCLPITLIFTISTYSSTTTLTTFTISCRHDIVAVVQPPPSSPPSPICKLSKNPSSKTLVKNITISHINTTTHRNLTVVDGRHSETLQKNTTLNRNVTVVADKHTGLKTLITGNKNVTVIDSKQPHHPYLKDDKDDAEVLKRASRVNPTPAGPKKIAFLFLTTTHLPFAPIWEMFFNQSGKNKNYNIYIHTNPKLLKYNTTRPFTGIFANRVVPNSKPTRRNTPTLISAARRLLAHALLDDPNNQIFTLLSSACVPLHSFNFTYKILTSSNVSFIEILSNEPTSYARWVARGEHAMLPEVPFEDFRVGSQFWSLTRSHARVVVEDVKLWRKFRLPCVNIATCYPEENYFPTLLYLIDPRGVVPATLTNVDWRGSYDGHPRVYNGSEVEFGLIQWLRWARPRYGDLGLNGSGLDLNTRWDPFLFARKFGPNCVEPLLSIANDVLFKD